MITFLDLFRDNPECRKYYGNTRYSISIDGRKEKIVLPQSIVNVVGTWYATEKLDGEISGAFGKIKLAEPIQPQALIPKKPLTTYSFVKKSICIQKGMSKQMPKQMLQEEVDIEVENTREITGAEIPYQLRNRKNSRSGYRAEFIIPKVEGQELFDFIDHIQLRFDTSIDIAIKLLEALRDIHEKGFIHADIKPENILYCQKTGKLTIIDFGLSRRATEIQRSCGTPLYVAPEVFHELITQKSDVFSLGVVMNLLFGIHYPFIERDRDMLLKGGINPFTLSKFPAVDSLPDSNRGYGFVDQMITQFPMMKTSFIVQYGQYKELFQKLKQVLGGLTKENPDKRMMIVEALARFRIIKQLYEDIVCSQNSFRKNKDSLKRVGFFSSNASQSRSIKVTSLVYEDRKAPILVSVR